MSTPVMSPRRTTVLATALVALGPLTMALYTPAMPDLVEAFATTPAVVKTTLSAYFIGFAVTQLIVGPLADAFGRRLSTLIFIGIYLVGSVAAALAPTVEILIVARLVQGIGASIGMTVSRAIVRDLYPGETGAKILNLVGIAMGSAPAFAPSIGGVMVSIAGWHSVFVLMVLSGVAVGAISLFALRETIKPDPTRLRPLAIARAYARLYGNAEFVTAATVIASGVGAIYAMATMLPFIMIEIVGLTPTQFGLSMLFQSGTFMVSSLILRIMMRWITPRQAVVPGIIFILLGSVGLAVTPHLFSVSLLSIMLPVAVYAFGVAQMMPFMLMAGLRPFPNIAGQAAAMTGFMQIGAGFLGGIIGTWIASPVLSISIIIPAMGGIAIAAYLLYRRASVKARRDEDTIEHTAVPITPAPAE